MRFVIRSALTAIWAVAFILFAFTLETLADALGWTEEVRKVARQGWRGMSDAGYTTVITTLFTFLSGMMTAVWGEFALRKWEARRRIENWARLSLEINDGQHTGKKHVGIDTVTILDGLVFGSLYKSDPKLTKHAISLIVQFDCQVETPCLHVAADRGVIWREVRSSDRYLMLEVDLLTKENVALDIVIRPLGWGGGTKHEAVLKWHDAMVLPREKLGVPTPAASPWHQSLQDTVARRLR